MREQPDLRYEEAQRVRTEEETDKKCPQCGGVMDFDPITGGLKCTYCDYTQEISHFPPTQELDFATAMQTGNYDWGAKMKTVICQSCGAESVYDALQTSNECPYCGSNQVMEEEGSNTLAPGGVCPFKIDIKAAGELFVKWISKKLFCPSKAKKKARPEAFNGVYLPYWTFDSQTDSQYTAEYGIERSSTDSDGNTTTHTDWYSTSGTYQTFIDDQLVCASKQHDTATLRKIEPFQTKENVSYKPEYISGFISERYAIGLQDAWQTAMALIHGRLSKEIEQKIKQEKHADSVRRMKLVTNHTEVTYKYLLLPVWLSSFTFKGKIYQFIVNGQTGKIGGKTPVSPWRVLAAVAIGIAIIAIIVLLNLYFGS